MLQKPCLNCRNLALPGKSRCRMCERTKGRAKQAKRNARPGDGAQARARAELKRAGAGVCNHCGSTAPATELEVDHILPLADGGTDYERNLQLLCRLCHRKKTSRENAMRLAHDC